MTTPTSAPGETRKRYRPYVPENMEMPEFTLRAVLLGLVMTVILGAANAYLGLRAGITIAATYPAAVIGMAVLRIWKGSVLEENIARTSGTIGEGIAAGAIFTIPAFLIAKAWPSFRPADAYWKTTALIMVGSVLGVLFISLVRRVMVEDPELPFPESVAASEIHKAGQRGAQAAKYLFWNIGVGGVVYMLGRFGLFASDQDLHFAVGNLGRSQVRLGAAGSTNVVAAGGTSMMAAPSVSPAYLGVGYIIGLRLASIQFAGGVLAWGLLVPLMIFFLGPRLKDFLPADTPDNWAAIAAAVWRFIVRPIAVGGMLVGAPGRRGSGAASAYRTIHEFENCPQSNCTDVCTHVFPLYKYLWAKVAGNFGSGRHAYCRLLLCHGFRQPVRFYWLIEQSSFWLNFIDVIDCGSLDGFLGSLGNLWRCDGVGRCRRGLCVIFRCRRAAAGFQSGIHPRRYASPNSACRIDRGGRSKSCNVLAADAAA